MNLAKDFIYVLNFRVLLISIISLVATFFCGYFQIIAEMPLSLIGLAVVFPIVFSINSAFQRRDRALEYYGIINSNLVSIYFAHCNWPKKIEARNSYKIKLIIFELLDLIKLDLINESKNNLIKKDIYKLFNKISKKNEDLRDVGISDLNFFLNDVISNFEKLSSISDYRTPKGLKAYSKIYLNIFPVIFAPYFANLNTDVYLLGFVVAILYSSVLVMLSNIQDNIENPFDLEGLDDINLNKENRFKNFL